MMKKIKNGVLHPIKEKAKFAVLFVLAGLMFTACAGGSDNADAAPTSGASDDYGNYDYSATEETETATVSDVPGEENQLDQSLELERKLIKTAHLNFQTDSLEQRKKIIDRSVKQFKAYVEHEEQYSSYDRETVTTTVRVPSDNFDAFVEAVCLGVGTFDSKTVAVDDVTEEYVDVEARIKTKKELKVRYTALLDRAETIKKIMEVEREIAALQAEIESYEGRLKYLSGSVRYATVNISYYQMLDVPKHFDNKFENAFSNGWEGFIWFFVGLVSIWPLLVVLTIILVIVRIQIKRRKAKIKNK